MKHRFTIMGVPYDEGATFLKGAGQGPDHLRAALASPSSNMWTETGVDLATPGLYTDAGDMVLPASGRVFDTIEAGAADLLAQGTIPIFFGGDHAITYPIVAALAAARGRLDILHFDAHPDLYDEIDGRRYSHASPMARILEDKLAARMVQVGIRTLNGHQRQQADKFGVRIIDMAHVQAARRLSFSGPLYISFDLDALDPAFAPGVSHHEPGGLSTRQVIEIIHGIEAEVVGCDIVELNPVRDPAGITAMAGAKVVKEIMGIIARQTAEGDHHDTTESTRCL